MISVTGLRHARRLSWSPNRETSQNKTSRWGTEENGTRGGFQLHTGPYKVGKKRRENLHVHHQRKVGNASGRWVQANKSKKVVSSCNFGCLKSLHGRIKSQRRPVSRKDKNTYFLLPAQRGRGNLFRTLLVQKGKMEGEGPEQKKK